MQRVPFLSLPDRIVSTSDSQAFAETVSLMLRLQDCDSLLPTEPFASRTGVVQLGQVSVLATSGSPIQAVAEAVEHSTFMLPYQGCDAAYSIEGKPYSNNSAGTSFTSRLWAGSCSCSRPCWRGSRCWFRPPCW
jgi:hypothetical protein